MAASSVGHDRTVRVWPLGSRTMGRENSVAIHINQLGRHPSVVATLDSDVNLRAGLLMRPEGFERDLPFALIFPSLRFP
jgi:hypothetical protein